MVISNIKRNIAYSIKIIFAYDGLFNKIHVVTTSVVYHFYLGLYVYRNYIVKNYQGFTNVCVMYIWKIDTSFTHQKRKDI